MFWTNARLHGSWLAAVCCLTTCLCPQGTFGAVRVTVLDPEGQPLKGAKVELLRYEGGDAFYSNLDLDEKESYRTVAAMPTPKNGSIGFQIPAALPHRLRVDVAPHAIEYRNNVFAGQELVIQLRAGAVVTGVVQNDRGDPLAAEDVSVRLDQRAGLLRTACDERGRFRFERVMPGSSYISAIASQGSSHGGQRVELRSGETTEVEFALDRGALVRGRITDAVTGKPIEGAKLGIGWTFKKSVVSDADGRYALQGLGGPYGNHLFVYAAGYCEQQIDRPKQKTGVVELDVQLQRGAEVRGRIVDLDGAPVADCYVAVVGMTHDGRRQETDWLPTRTDAEGRFKIDSVRPELSPVLLVRRDQRATIVLPIPEFGAEKTQNLGDVALRPRRVLQGVALEADGTPAAGLKIHLKGCNADAPDHTRPGGQGLAFILQGYVAQRSTVTDSQGRFWFGDLAGGAEYSLKFDNTQLAVEVGAEVDPEPLELRR